MSRDDHVVLAGTITDVFAGGQFSVKTTTGTTVRAQLCGKMRKNKIRVLLGDHVQVSLSPYDLSHGLITFRSK